MKITQRAGKKNRLFIIVFVLKKNAEVFDQSAHRKTLLSEPNAYDKWRGPGCVQIPLLTEPNAYDKWRAHGHRVRRAFFQKNLFFFPRDFFLNSQSFRSERAVEKRVN